MFPYWPLLSLLLLCLGTCIYSLTSSNPKPSDVFHITDELGRGTFGAVFKARLRGTTKEFALKLSIPVVDQPFLIRKADSILENELKVLKSLHTNVKGMEQRRFLALLSSEFQQSQSFNFRQALLASPSAVQPQPSPDRSFQDFEKRLTGREPKALIFPLYDGGDLYSLLEDVEFEQQRRLTDSEICSLALGIVRALQVLHSVGYVHLDLKPDNIMLDTSRPIPGSDIGQPVLIDFGLARKIGTKAHPGGAPGYMAPELSNVTGVMYSGAEDVFSFGSLLIQLKLQRILASFQLDAEQERIWDLESTELGLVGRCWSKDPAQRPTFDEIAEELQAFCSRSLFTNSPSQSVPAHPEENNAVRKPTLATLMKLISREFGMEPSKPEPSKPKSFKPWRIVKKWMCCW